MENRETVTIPFARYDELLRKSAKTDALIDYVMMKKNSSSYIEKDEILTILGVNIGDGKSDD